MAYTFLFQESNNHTTIRYYIWKYVIFSSSYEVNLRNALDYSSSEKIISITSYLWMRESARLPTLYELYKRQQPDRYESVYTACWGENTVCTLIAYGKRVRRPHARSFSPARKMANTRTTNYFASLRVEGTHIRINPFSSQGSVPRRGLLTHDNTAPTKESNSHLRYYTQITRKQIWVLNETRICMSGFHGIEDSLIWSFPIYDNDDNGNTNFTSSKMRS